MSIKREVKVELEEKKKIKEEEKRNLESIIDITQNGENSGSIHSVKKCTVNLPKVSTKKYFRGHMQNQLESAKFACQECDYKSKQKGNLIRHMQAKHVGVKFNCQKCSYMTQYEGDLRRHMLTKHIKGELSKRMQAKHIQGEHEAIKMFRKMAERMNLTKTITDRANNLFKTVHNGRNLKGRIKNDAIAAACMYIACRQEGVPRTFKEIEVVSTVSKTEIGRCFNLILKAHDISVDHPTTADFMSRFCGTLGLARDVQKAATHIAKKIVDMEIVPGTFPNIVAAAAIYMASQASDDKRTQREIADIAGIKSTFHLQKKIRQYYSLMLPIAGELFPTDFKFTTNIENLSQN